MAQTSLKFEIPNDTLHDRLGGVIPGGTIMAIVGKFGSGKSVLSQRLTYGFLHNKHSVSYISTEMTTASFLKQMNSLDYKILDYLILKTLRFVPVYPLIGKPLDRKDFLSRLMNAQHLFETDVIVIDTFSAFAKDELNVKKSLEVLSFFKKVVVSKKSIILTIDIDEMSSDCLTQFLATVDICLNIDKQFIEGAIQRIILIERYSSAEYHVGSVIAFRIEPKSGLIVDITTVA